MRTSKRRSRASRTPSVSQRSSANECKQTQITRLCSTGSTYVGRVVKRWVELTEEIPHRSERMTVEGAAWKYVIVVAVVVVPVKECRYLLFCLKVVCKHNH